jgi:hypothetical protein
VVAFQVVITTHTATLRDVNLHPTPLAGPGGSSIPATSISLYREAMLNVSTPSLIHPRGDEAGPWPDALVPIGRDRYYHETRNGSPFDIPMDCNQPVWVEVRIPNGAAPGDYSGSISVSAAGMATRLVPVRAHVWDFAIPRSSSLPTAFGLAAGPRIRHHLSYASTEKLTELYVREALEHRITLSGLWASNALPDYEYDPAHPERGAVVRDWSRIDDFYSAPMAGLPEGKATTIDVPAMVNLRSELQPPQASAATSPGRGTLQPGKYAYRVTAVNTEGETEGSSVVYTEVQQGGSVILTWPKVVHPRWPRLSAVRYRIYRAVNPEQMEDDNPPTYLLAETAYTQFADDGVARERHGIRCPAAGNTGNREALALYRAYADHYRRKGWLDRAWCYAADEPFTNKHIESARIHALLWRKAVPKGWSLVTNVYSPQLEGAVNLWCVVTNWFDDLDHGRASDVRAHQRRGERVWWYQAMMSRGDPIHRGGAWPSFFVDDDAMAARTIGFYTWRFGFDGFLYYLVDMAYQKDNDPWRNLFYFSANGDGTLFYPGTPEHIGGAHDIPISSLRLALIRQGLQDYEYLKLLADLGDRPLADREAARLVQAADRYTRDDGAATVDTVRAEMARRIEELSRPRR